MITSKQKSEYRGFTLSVYDYAASGKWGGMARGLGTVILPGGGTKATAGEVIADLQRRIDLGYSRGLGVFAGKA